MDQMIIETGFVQSSLARVVKKAVSKIIGVNLDLNFNDPISVQFDGEQALVHLNVNAKMSKEDLGKLVKDLV